MDEVIAGLIIYICYVVGVYIGWFFRVTPDIYFDKLDIYLNKLKIYFGKLKKKK